MICDIHYNKHFRTYYRAKKAFDDYVMQIFSGLSTYAWISHIREFWENLKGNGYDTQ